MRGIFSIAVCAAALTSSASGFDLGDLGINIPSIGLPDLTGGSDSAFSNLVDWFASLIGPDTVSELDLETYIGRWYQVYTSIIPFVTFENEGKCVTADYSLNPDGSIAVFNANRPRNDPTVNGTLHTAYGNATVPNADEPGKLEVSFANDTPSLGANYWVLALGPVIDGEYQYSVVSDSLRASLFVLARNVSDYFATYNEDVQTFLDDKGFKYPWNQPIKTYQESDCAYA